HAEVSVVSARALAGQLLGARGRARARAQDTGTELVPTPLAARRVLRRRARLPPHRADLGDPRARRGAAAGRGRGNGGARRAPSHGRRTVDRGGGRARLHAARSKALPAADADDAAAAGDGRTPWRGGAAPRTARALRGRGRWRARQARGPGLARGADGRERATDQRRSPALRAAQRIGLILSARAVGSSR